MFRQKIIIIVINYGTTEYIKELLKNFLASLPPFPKTRIDWAVTDTEDKFQFGDKEWQGMMKKEFRNKKANYFHFFKIPNRGFASNVNLSFRLLRQKLGLEYKIGKSDLVLVLNPDTSLYWDSLEKGINFINENPKAAVVGMALTNPQGQLEKWGHSLIFPSLKLFWGRKRFSEPSLSDNPTSVAWVSGGAMLIQTNWWERLQGFNENYYLYFEDVDFCRRVRMNDGDIFFLPQATVNHRRGGSKISIYRRKKYYYASEARYFHLYRSPSEYLLLRLLRFPFKVFYFFRCYLAFSFLKEEIKKIKLSIYFERKEGFPHFFSFARVPFLKEIWLATFFLSFAVLGEAIWGKTYLSPPLILHYNAYLGIDFYGDVISLFTFPLLAFLILIFNFFLGTALYFSKKYMLFSIIPASTSLAFQMLLFVAFLNLLMVNN